MRDNPFRGVAARSHGNLHFARGGELAPADGVETERAEFLRAAHDAFRETIEHDGFPCLGAKAALHHQAYAFATYGDLGANDSTAGLASDLCTFVACEEMMQDDYATFIAVFSGPWMSGELEFERLLWQELRKLHRLDAKHSEWDAAVSADPADPEFSFSFAGHAFYVLGMHPDSSRLARRFPWPAIAFNPHAQFERLRADGHWHRMQQSIRERELALQGSINPMLSDFGEESEARQYSGRAVEKDWQAPFAANDAAARCPFAH